MALSQDPDGRTRLIEAALSCMADHGYRGATVRRIAARAGVTPGLVRHHFAGKEALLVETYRYVNRAALARMAESSAQVDQGDIERALDATIRAFFPDNLRNPQQMRIMVVFWGLVLTSPEIAVIQRETNAAFQAHLVGLIGQHLKRRKHAADIADGIIAIADGLWLECCLNPDRMTPERALETALRFGRAALRAETARG